MNERIKELRKALGLTQHEFADKLGISRGNIGSYEVGKSQPGGSVISLICKTFNVNEEWLRSGTGEMFAEADTFSLDEYAASHGCTDLERDFLKAFFDLDPAVRNKVLSHFAESLAKRKPNPPSDMESRMTALESQVEELKKEEPAPRAPVPAQSTSRSR